MAILPNAAVNISNFLIRLLNENYTRVLKLFRPGTHTPELFDEELKKEISIT